MDVFYIKIMPPFAVLSMRLIDSIYQLTESYFRYYTKHSKNHKVSQRFNFQRLFRDSIIAMKALAGGRFFHLHKSPKSALFRIVIGSVLFLFAKKFIIFFNDRIET